MSIQFNEKYVPKGEHIDDAGNGGDDKPRGQSIYQRRASRKGSVVNPKPTPVPEDTLVNSDRAYSTVAETLPDFTDLHDESKEHTEKETSMGFWEGIRTYPNAAAWSVLLSSSIIMEGYDTNLLGSFFAFPPFAQKYGDQLPSGSYQVPAGWETGLMDASQVGSMIGLFLNGIMCDRIGYKKTYFAALIMMTAFIFLPFFAPNRGVLLAGQALSGLPWGMFQTLSVAYASEVCPVSLRGYLTTYANICWVVGQILSSGVLRALLSRQGEWAYRIPFGLQWMFIPPIAIGVVFAPESPWWLVRNGHYERAAKEVRRLMSKQERQDENAVTNTISHMKLTNEHEKALSAGTSYIDCFKGIDLRRTEVATLTWAAQNFCGSAFMGYSTYFYQNAGLPTEQAFNFSIAQYALGLIGTFGSWVLMSYFGRRTLYIAGLVILVFVLVGIGGAGFAPPDATIVNDGAKVAVNTAASWAVGSLLLVFTLSYDLTVGPVCYAIVAECSSTRLRQKTIVIARMVYNVGGILNNVWTPLQLNPGAWNWGAKSGLFWAGISLICLAWCYFRLPETKGRTYNELTILFENRVSARKFKSTKVDSFRSESVQVTSDSASVNSDEKV